MSEAAKPRRRADNEYVICPWCGHGHGDAWEWAKERTETRCDACEKSFTVEPDYAITYWSFVTGEENP